MTEKQAKKLVSWVKKGNAPETFPETGKTETSKGSKQQNYDPGDPYADLWKPMPKSFHMRRTKKGYNISINVDAADAPLAVYGARAFIKARELKQDGSASQSNEFMDAMTTLVEASFQQDPALVEKAIPEFSSSRLRPKMDGEAMAGRQGVRDSSNAR